MTENIDGAARIFDELSEREQINVLKSQVQQLSSELEQYFDRSPVRLVDGENEEVMLLPLLPISVIYATHSWFRADVSSVIDIAERNYGLEKGTLINKSRDETHVEARWVVSHLLRKNTRMSYPEIGRALDQDHTTVIHGVRRLREILTRDAAVNKMAGRIEDEINAEAGPGRDIVILIDGDLMRCSLSEISFGDKLALNYSGDYLVDTGIIIEDAKLWERYGRPALQSLKSLAARVRRVPDYLHSVQDSSNL